MGVEITETSHPNYTNLRHFTVTLLGNDDTHTISTTLTTHPGIARDWLHSTLHTHRTHRHRLIIGLGVQWTPDYYYHHHRSAATIQLCIGRRCLIFHLRHANSSPRILRRILSDPRNTFVGFWNVQDAARLLESQHQLEMVSGMPLDLRYHVEGDGGRSMRGASIADIAEEVIGVDVHRSDEVGRSDWEVEYLSIDQVKYAAVDAFLAYAVAMRIHAWELNTNI